LNIYGESTSGPNGGYSKKSSDGSSKETWQGWKTIGPKWLRHQRAWAKMTLTRKRNALTLLGAWVKFVNEERRKRSKKENEQNRGTEQSREGISSLNRTSERLVKDVLVLRLKGKERVKKGSDCRKKITTEEEAQVG